MNGLLKSFLVAFFFLWCALGYLQNAFHFIRIDPVTETRDRIAKPAGEMITSIFTDPLYYQKYEYYFKDSFPLRDLFIRFKSQVDYSLLNYTKEIIVGENGWLCDKKLMLQLQETDNLSDAQLDTAVTMLKALRDDLAAHSITFLVVIIPLKPSIYPEYFPERKVSRRNPTGLDRFQNMMRSSGVYYVDLLPVFMANKHESPIFFKTDMHINNLGTHFMAEAVADWIARDSSVARSQSEPLKTQEVQEFSGEESKSLPILFPVKERHAAKYVSNSIFIRKDEHHDDYIISKFETQRTDLLPGVLMFGNSFMLRYETVGFYNLFNYSSRLLDYSSFRNIDSVISKESSTAKYVVLQVYETQILFHLTSLLKNWYWSERYIGVAQSLKKE